MPDETARYTALADMALARLTELDTIDDKEFGRRAADLAKAVRAGHGSPDQLVEALALFGAAARRDGGPGPTLLDLVGAAGACSGQTIEMPVGVSTATVATISGYWWSLRGDPVHVITATEADAVTQTRAAAGPLTKLGLTVDVVTSGSTVDRRRVAYARPIVYTSCQEVTYDYLRDNLADDRADLVLGERRVAVVADADVALIDRARSMSTITAPRTAGTEGRQTIAAMTTRGCLTGYRTLVGVAATGGSAAADLHRLYSIQPTRVGAGGRSDRHPDLVYPNDESRLEDLARRVAKENTRGRPVIVGVAPPVSVDMVREVMDAHEIRYQFDASGLDPQIPAAAGRRNAVTVFDLRQPRPSTVRLGGESSWAADAPDDGALSREREELEGLGGFAVFGVGSEAPSRLWEWLAGLVSSEKGEVRFLLAVTDPILSGLDNPITRMIRRIRPNRVDVADRRAVGSSLARLIDSGRRAADVVYSDGLAAGVELDRVQDGQAETVYALRRRILAEDGAAPVIQEFIAAIVDAWSMRGAGGGNAGLLASVRVDPRHAADAAGISAPREAFDVAYRSRTRAVGEPAMRNMERRVLLSVIDRYWAGHLTTLALLREQDLGLTTYREEARRMYGAMTERLRIDALRYIFQLDGGRSM